MVEIKAHLDRTSHPQLSIAQTLPQKRALLGLLCSLPDTGSIYFHACVLCPWSPMVLFSNITLYSSLDLAILTIQYVFYYCDGS